MTDWEKRVHALVDKQILETTGYDPIVLLRDEGRLNQQLFQAWLEGHASLTEALFGSRERIVVILHEAALWATKLGLIRVERPLSDSETHVSRVIRSFAEKHPDLAKLMQISYARPTRQQSDLQLDLFMDSAPQVTIHQLQDAIAHHELEKAQQLWQELRLLDPLSKLLSQAESLLLLLRKLPQYLDDPSACDNFLGRQIDPLATALLGGRAVDFLKPLWQQLAHKTASDNPSFQGTLQAARFFAKASDWEGVIRVIQTQPGWQQNDLLLSNCLEAWEQRSEEEAFAVHLILFFWNAPQKASEFMSARNHHLTLFDESWADWLDEEFSADLSCFPAFVYLCKPQVCRNLPLPVAEVARQPVWLSVAQLMLHPKEIESRMALKNLSEPLFSFFMRRQTVVLKNSPSSASEKHTHSGSMTH